MTIVNVASLPFGFIMVLLSLLIATHDYRVAAMRWNAFEADVSSEPALIAASLLQEQHHVQRQNSSIFASDSSDSSDSSSSSSSSSSSALKESLATVKVTSSPQHSVNLSLTCCPCIPPR